jgi:hypothetical protein
MSLLSFRALVLVLQISGGQKPKTWAMNQTNVSDLAEEIQARKETDVWDLRSCPCCGYKALVHVWDNSVTITCAQWGCRVVEAKTMADAVALWNLPRFSDKSNASKQTISAQDHR